ncbi:site-specific integrase [Alistipes sp. OttesenSCG-928-L06]|nr:site-specific integrase [Alistipes sp. OttesenSCG-928-L06]
MIKTDFLVGGGLEMRINFNLQKKHNSSKSQIWLTTSINGERVRIQTKERINPLYWQKSNRHWVGEKAIESDQWGPIVQQECININNRLMQILGFCQEYANEVSVQNLRKKAVRHTKTNFEEYIKGRIKGINIFERQSPEQFILDLIEKKKTTINRKTGVAIHPDTIGNHYTCLKRLKKYCAEEKKNLIWDLFNNKFERDFEEWFIFEQGYAPNTLSHQYSIMKTWMKEANKSDLLKDTTYQSWPTATYEVDNIYLTEDEIERIYQIDFSDTEVKKRIDSKSQIEITRDLFIIACWTGLRFGDYSDLSKATMNEQEGLMWVPTSKTRELVSFPISNYVDAIYKKYGNKFPKAIDKAHSIKHLQQCGEIANINQEVIIRKVRGGKSVIRKEPKFKFIMNHTARRSFATNQYLRRIPVETIMSVTGHTSTENFYKYIKISREEHALEIKKVWDEAGLTPPLQ